MSDIYVKTGLEIVPAPRANREGRLDLPWNAVYKVSRFIVYHGKSRDDAEAFVIRRWRKMPVYNWEEHRRLHPEFYPPQRSK